MKEFFAVIVSFNPDISRMRSNINILLNQGFRTIVVDNGSDQPPEQLADIAELVLLGENKGIATALNIGMGKAKEHGGEWVLSLDQDSEPADNILEEYKKHLDLSDIGALCPKIVRRGVEKNDQSEAVELVKRCPTAGFFLSVNVWETVGKYDDWMFIDYVDYDICTRIIIAGFNIYRINSTFVIQELGKLYVNPFFYNLGKKLNWQKMINFAHTYNHSAFRNYYFVRNSYYYIHKHKNYINVLGEKKWIRKWELKKLFLEPHKIALIKSIHKGIKDAKKKIKKNES